MDLSKYIAGRYCAHMHEIAEISRGRFASGIFKVDSTESNCFSALEGYRVSIEDYGNYMRVTFNGKKIDAGFLRKKIGELTVPTKYRNILSDLKIDEREGRLSVDARFAPMNNASGRSQNEDHIYFSIRNAVIKPVFSAILRE